MLKSRKLDIFKHTVFILMIVAVAFPILAMLNISISDAETIVESGYQFIPKKISFLAYETVLSYGVPLIKALAVSIASAVIGPGLGVIVCSLAGYAIAARGFAYKKIANAILIAGMLLNAGLIPTYIVWSQWYGLADNLLVYCVPAVSAWNVILFRTFFSGIPEELMEAARIDGATELQTFAKVTVPMSKSILASVFFTGALATWNDYTKPLYYITNRDYYNIQYFLQIISREVSELNELYKNNPLFAGGGRMPEETLPFAIAAISLVPVLLAFPYMQKYFSKGIATGSVKG